MLFVTLPQGISNDQAASLHCYLHLQLCHNFVSGNIQIMFGNKTFAHYFKYTCNVSLFYFFFTNTCIIYTPLVMESLCYYDINSKVLLVLSMTNGLPLSMVNGNL